MNSKLYDNSAFSHLRILFSNLSALHRLKISQSLHWYTQLPRLRSVSYKNKTLYLRYGQLSW